MSAYTNNAIYTKIRASVLAVDPKTYCTQTYNPTPDKFPCVFAREIGRLTPPATVTFTNSQDINETTWEVQVFSNLTSGSKEQAYDLMDAVKSALTELYFVETFEQPFDAMDKTYTTLVARYRRIIGSGESIPNSTAPSA